MDKNIYRILKELNSLEQRLPDLEKGIFSERQRIEKIKKMRSLREGQMSQCIDQNTEQESSLKMIEAELEVLSKKKDETTQHLKEVIKESEISKLEQQLDFIKDQIDSKEEQGLIYVEEIEQRSDEIEAAKTFLVGSLESIKEIEDDIKLNNSELFKELEIIEKRVSLLKDELPEKVTKKYNSLKNKGQNFIPVSELKENNCCMLCGYLLPNALAQSIESLKRFGACPNCERIIIPQGSKYI